MISLAAVVFTVGFFLGRNRPGVLIIETERAEEAMPVTEPVAVSTQVIDLNTATADELEVLPGIGPSISAEIIAYREEHGVFSSVEDILEVSGIGESKLNSIRDYITVR